MGGTVGGLIPAGRAFPPNRRATPPASFSSWLGRKVGSSMANENEKPLRAVGYCRTSGEGQRDNTSIPRQKDAIEAFCKVNGWQLLQFYVDECRSGANIVGRDSFQEMMKHATDGQFDVIVPYDATRFARDGVDILSSPSF